MDEEHKRGRVSDNRLVDLQVNIPTLVVIVIQTIAAASAVAALFYDNNQQTKQLIEMTARLYQVERSMASSQVLESRMNTAEYELRILRSHVDQMNNTKQVR